MSLSRRGSFFEVEISEDEAEQPKSEFLDRVLEETEEKDEVTELKNSKLKEDIFDASDRLRSASLANLGLTDEVAATGGDGYQACLELKDLVEQIVENFEIIRNLEEEIVNQS
ncbi:Oidioi.mRNA.OKI2018_I69.XSR.g15644.t1.cds [Oikopleura dioica]|uniref:Oidioi.mRNA.OKI2018_I69.XSR.g15644.t1.cds n=1 Tax=Oikopleura dioica TaxID=34765 RepID=A0ABN7SKX0_OIKDI|nr:Oidioi.mRNA.OKI2018_I69.XSR.g15644.t1.cds [Oikopleura dioica]